MLYWYTVCAVLFLQGRPGTMRWTFFFLDFVRPQRPTTMHGNRNLYFLMKAFRPPLHRPWFNRIFRPDCTTASTLKLPQWHAHILPMYNVCELVLVNLCTLFFSHLLTRSLSHYRRITGHSCAWEWEVKQHAAASSSTCDYMINVYLNIFYTPDTVDLIPHTRINDIPI